MGEREISEEVAKQREEAIDQQIEMAISLLDVADRHATDARNGETALQQLGLAWGLITQLMLVHPERKPRLIRQLASSESTLILQEAAPLIVGYALEDPVDGLDVISVALQHDDAAARYDVLEALSEVVSVDPAEDQLGLDFAVALPGVSLKLLPETGGIELSID